MKTFYFEDENGTYFSPKKTRRFKKLSGIEAYDYLNEEAQKGIKHRFLRFDIEHPSPIKEVDGYEPEPPAEPIIEKVFVEVIESEDGINYSKVFVIEFMKTE